MSIKWPNDFDGAHSVGGVDTGTSDPLYGAVPPGTSDPLYGAVPPKIDLSKIYESPDGDKTVYVRSFGETEQLKKYHEAQQELPL